MVEVGVYLRGGELQPDKVTKVLGVQPSHAQTRGEVRASRSATPIVSNIGVWALLREGKMGEVDNLVRGLLESLPANGSLRDLADVEEAYLDIFLAVSARIDGGGGCDLRLDDELLSQISGLGLAIQVTLTVVRE